MISASDKDGAFLAHAPARIATPPTSVSLTPPRSHAVARACPPRPRPPPCNAHAAEPRITQERMTIIRNACGLDFRSSLFVCMPGATLKDYVAKYRPAPAPPPAHPCVLAR